MNPTHRRKIPTKKARQGTKTSLGGRKSMEKDGKSGYSIQEEVVWDIDFGMPKNTI